MKRINYDELILFMLLVILDLLMIVLIESDEIQNFINGHMLIFFKISVIILVLFSICQFSKIFTIPSRIYITNKFFPLIFFLIIFLLYFAYADDKDEVISDSFNDILFITENIDNYEGDMLYFKGFIYGFSLSSCYWVFKYKGLILSFIYAFPTIIINLIVVLILLVYSILFTSYLWKVIFAKDRNTGIKRFLKKYLFVLLICLVLGLISSFLEAYLVPSMIKLVIKLFI